MTASPAPAPPEIKTNNLALAFQEVFTVILRTRFFQQRVENAEAFRATLRKMISAAVKDASTLGYSDEASKMAIYAMIGFLDESVLNSKDPTFADWARRPLQEEMFGGHFAGEYFFRNVTELLNRPESLEVADVLELHALCLLLGYRGRFAFGDASEIHTILQRIREKIARIRGSYALFRPMETPSAPPAPKGDPWVGRLAIVAILLVVFTILAYAGYIFFLGQSLPAASHLISPKDPLAHAQDYVILSNPTRSMRVASRNEPPPDQPQLPCAPFIRSFPANEWASTNLNRNLFVQSEAHFNGVEGSACSPKRTSL